MSGIICPYVFSQALGFRCFYGMAINPGATVVCLCGPGQAPQFFYSSVSSSEIIIGHASQGGCETLDNSIKHFKH